MDSFVFRICQIRTWLEKVYGFLCFQNMSDPYMARESKGWLGKVYGFLCFQNMSDPYVARESIWIPLLSEYVISVHG